MEGEIGDESRWQAQRGEGGGGGVVKKYSIFVAAILFIRQTTRRLQVGEGLENYVIQPD